MVSISVKGMLWCMHWAHTSYPPMAGPSILANILPQNVFVSYPKSMQVILFLCNLSGFERFPYMTFLSVTAAGTREHPQIRESVRIQQHVRSSKKFGEKGGPPKAVGQPECSEMPNAVC